MGNSSTTLQRVSTDVNEHSTSVDVNNSVTPRQPYLDALSRLLSTAVSVKATDEWKRLWEWPKCADDVWKRFSFTLMRTLRCKNPYNFAALISSLIVKLESFPLEIDEAALPLPDTLTQHRHILNCVRLLIRCIPIALENNDDEFSSEFLQQGKFPSITSLVPNINESSLNAVNECIVVDDNMCVTSPMQRIAHTLMRLLFVPGFTVCDIHSTVFCSIDAFENEHIGAINIWSGNEYNTTTSMYHARIEIMKCLISCSSVGLFSPPQCFRHDSNEFVQCMVSSSNSYIHAFVVSLLEIVTSFHPGMLPYSHAIFEAQRDTLISFALQLLIILLDFRTLEKESHNESCPENPSVDDTSAASSLENVALQHIASICLPSNLKQIFEGITRILHNCLDADNSYLPHSVKPLDCSQEALVLFWRLLNTNKALYEFIATRAEARELLLPVLYVMCKNRFDAGKIGIIHTCALILLKMSAEREFALAFNQMCSYTFPLDYVNTNGTFADLFINLVHDLMQNMSTFADSLYHVLMTTLCNISPYVRSLNWEASSKLLHVFERLSHSKFLNAAKNNHQYVSFLIEIFNNILQYQYIGNARLMYGITQKSRRFFELAQIPIALKRSQVKRTTSSSSETLKVSDDADSTFTTSSRQNSSSISSHHAHNARQNNASSTYNIDSIKDASDKTIGSVDDDEDETLHKKRTDNNTMVDEKYRGNAVRSIRTIPQAESPNPSTSPTHQSVTELNRFTSRQNTSILSHPTSESKAAHSHIEWIASWKRKLPLSPIIRALEFFLPRMNALIESGAIHNESKVLNFFESCTLVGVLPLPHSIMVRRYRESAYTSHWFSSFFWGIIFLRHQRRLLFDPSAVKLFSISQSG